MPRQREPRPLRQRARGHALQEEAPRRGAHVAGNDLPGAHAEELDRLVRER